MRYIDRLRVLLFCKSLKRQRKERVYRSFFSYSKAYKNFTNLLHVYLAFNLTIYTIDLIIYLLLNIKNNLPYQLNFVEKPCLSGYGFSV